MAESYCLCFESVNIHQVVPFSSKPPLFISEHELRDYISIETELWRIMSGMLCAITGTLASAIFMLARCLAHEIMMGKIDKSSYGME